MSVVLVAFVLIILSGAEHLFLSSVYPDASLLFMYVLKYSYLAVLFSVLLKNPGVISRHKTASLTTTGDEE